MNKLQIRAERAAAAKAERQQNMVEAGELAKAAAEKAGLPQSAVETASAVAIGQVAAAMQGPGR